MNYKIDCAWNRENFTWRKFVPSWFQHILQSGPAPGKHSVATTVQPLSSPDLSMSELSLSYQLKSTLKSHHSAIWKNLKENITRVQNSVRAEDFQLSINAWQSSWQRHVSTERDFNSQQIKMVYIRVFKFRTPINAIPEVLCRMTLPHEHYSFSVYIIKYHNESSLKYLLWLSVQFSTGKFYNNWRSLNYTEMYTLKMSGEPCSLCFHNVY